MDDKFKIVDSVFQGFNVGDTSVDNESNDEPTVQEYARFYGLTRNYLSQPCLASEYLPSPPEGITKDLEDYEGLSTLSELATINLHEKLTFSKDTAVFLHNITRPLAMDDLREEEHIFLRRIASMKQEVPLLRTDHELDMRSSGRFHSPAIRLVTLPPELFTDKEGDGMSWPQAHLDAPKEIATRLSTEKLVIGKDTMLLLRDCIKKEAPVEVPETYRTKHHHMRESVTPNLLPISPSPTLPPSPNPHFELPSSGIDSLAAEVQTVQDVIMAQDTISSKAANGNARSQSNDSLLYDQPIGELYSPLSGIEDTPSSPLRKRKVDSHVEVPLTPVRVDSPAKKLKTAPFQEMLHENTLELPSTIDNGDALLGSQNSFDAFFKDEVVPAAEKINRALEQEQLQEMDTTRRVVVPVVDLTPPLPPWKLYSCDEQAGYRESEAEIDAQRRLLARAGREELQLMKHWAGASRLELSLPWNPFPNEFGTVALDEAIHDDKTTADLAHEAATGAVDSSSLTWKPDGLRILDNSDESDDELEPGEFEELNDLDSLVAKRKLELQQQEAEILEERPAEQTRIDLPVMYAPATNLSTVQLQRKMSVVAEQSSRQEPDHGSMFGDMFSATTAVDKFLQVQDAKLAEPQHPTNKCLMKQNLESTTPQTQPAAKDPEPATASGPEFPLQPLPATLPSTAIIISTTLHTTSRPLLRTLSALHPPLTLIERDFSTTTTIATPSAIPDLILSPATTLLLSTLQSLKQRPLPGARPSTTPLLTRIATLSTHFARIHILVSSSPASSTSAHAAAPLDESDALALARLSASTSTSRMPDGCEVSVVYVPGGLQHLARAVLGAWARYAPAPMNILAEETIWEGLLRRAGLNAFAAQGVLGALKEGAGPGNGEDGSDPSGEGDGTRAMVGLPAFVLMEQAEREERFAGMMGGVGVLRRVGRVLDGGWVSASDGFRGA